MPPRNWFNNIRIHGTIGYLTPVEFKQQPYNFCPI
ncbi:IS3 family transposase [Agaribacter marinus]|uniref:IS3 family transposase n=1 Tax=Virgibacillus salarius TaxID=447199 RepID=A0A941DZ90_9BACI|nr:IS3 family transposase [Virgibacillus salarius]NAZ10781.1 IS3 family transposase [Agaribacter marinus]